MTDSIRALLDKVPQYRDRDPVATRLTGGLTNQIFRVDVDDDTHVLRVLTPGTERLGIDRDHENACSRNAAELGIGPEVIHYSCADGVLVIRFVAGDTLSATDAREPDRIARIAPVIRRLHDGPEIPGRFCPFEVVRAYRLLADENDVSFPATLPRAVEIMESIETALAPHRTSRPCHNDLLAANFLDDGKRIWLVDWEYGGMGDPLFDLGNFAVNQELGDDGQRLLLEQYFGELRGRDVAHLKLMMLASDLRESLWGFLQSGIAELDEDYFGYGAKHLERFLSRAEAGEFSAWVEGVAGGK